MRRLKKGQKEAVLEWIAAGLKSDEINEKAAKFIPPFSVSSRTVTYYRNTRKADIVALIAAGEQEALSEGLALKGERVRKLKQLATLMERDLFGGFLWLEQVKGVGSGDAATIVDYEEFNRGEVAEYRSTLDDIAKEMGHRVTRQEISGRDGEAIEITDHRTELERRLLGISANTDASEVPEDTE
jgi:hypothetical protein